MLCTFLLPFLTTTSLYLSLIFRFPVFHLFFIPSSVDVLLHEFPSFLSFTFFPTGPLALVCFLACCPCCLACYYFFFLTHCPRKELSLDRHRYGNGFSLYLSHKSCPKQNRVLLKIPRRFCLGHTGGQDSLDFAVRSNCRCCAGMFCSCNPWYSF